MSKATPIPAAVRKAVLRRADGRCERCGREGPLELHHRRYRSRGGKHLVVNLVALCGWGNHTGCHGWAHQGREANLLGYSIASWADPATEPVVRDGQACLLHEDGRVTLA